MSFNNSSGFHFNGKPTFNNVHGNQVNNNHITITAAVVHTRGDDTTVTECTISNDFETVKRGHVIGMKDLGSVNLSERDWRWQNGKMVRQQRKSARKTISTVGIHPDRQSKFTVITYEGEGAQEAWEDDFKQFSHASRTDFFQLFGINRSDIPMLIFHHELIPVAHFFTDSFWMNTYLRYLTKKRGCSEQDLWLNTSSGVLCEGPTGPHFLVWRFGTDTSAIEALPSSLDMLEEGTSVAFFSKFESNMDSGILECAGLLDLDKETYLDDLSKTTGDLQHKDNNHPQWTANHRYLKPLWRNPPHHLPISIIGGLRFDTVYSPLLEPVARWPPEAPVLWKWWDVDGLVEETRIDGGLTRFKLIGQGGKVSLRAEFDQETFRNGWFTQSSRVFDLLKATGHQESFFVVGPPQLHLQSTQQEYTAYDGPPAPSDLCDAVEESQPIYHFLHPPPMTVSEFISWMGRHTHFWSFDENGRSRIPEEEWARWSIPILTPYTNSYILLYSWPTHIYSALHNWQIARGFDPSTADWARECSYPEFEIVRAKKDGRLKEISEQPEESGWSWSRLWTAIPGSDISACAC